MSVPARVEAARPDVRTARSTHHARRRTASAGPFAAAALAAAALLGCGAGGSGEDFDLAPGGITVGNLVCSTFLLPNPNVGAAGVVQGESIQVTFSLRDVNLDTPAIAVPISFEVVGGSLSSIPTVTDASGEASVIFTADVDFLGAALVRLIQPTARLRCDAGFTVVQPACVLAAQVLDGAGTVVPGFGFDACGTTEVQLRSNIGRRVLYRVTRRDPATGIILPVRGAFIQLDGVNLRFDSIVIGPTNAQGLIEAGDTDGDAAVEEPMTPFALGVDTATLTAEVILADANGDGYLDSRPCNTCVLTWGLVRPECASTGAETNVAYFDAGGMATAGPVRPGESADVTAQVLVDGVPQVNFPVFVAALNGSLDDSAIPVFLMTDGSGRVTVTYRPNLGFEGADQVVFRAQDPNVECVLTANVNVVTCAFGISTVPSPVSNGAPALITLTLPAAVADPASAAGQRLALTATGGTLPPAPPPLIVDLQPGGGGVRATFGFVPTMGFVGMGSVTARFIDGYPCLPETLEFPIAP